MAPSEKVGPAPAADAPAETARWREWTSGTADRFRELGFSAAELRDAREHAEASAASYAERIRQSMSTARRGVGSATQRIWKHTQTLARHGWSRAKKNTPAN